MGPWLVKSKACRAEQPLLTVYWSYTSHVEPPTSNRRQNNNHMFLVAQHCGGVAHWHQYAFLPEKCFYIQKEDVLKIKPMRGRHVLNEFKYCFTRPADDLFLLKLVMGASPEELKIVLTADWNHHSFGTIFSFYLSITRTVHLTMSSSSISRLFVFYQ